MTVAVSRPVNQAVVETLVQGAFGQSFRIADEVVANIDDAIVDLAQRSGTGYGSNFQRNMTSASTASSFLQFPGGVGAGNVDEGINLLRSADEVGARMSTLDSAARREVNREEAASLRAQVDGLRPEATELLENARESFGFAIREARDAAEGVVFTLLR